MREQTLKTLAREGIEELGDNRKIYTLPLAHLGEESHLIARHFAADTFHLSLTAATEEIETDAIGVGLDQFL
uniref:Uncharacterized protein n=1 Tax=Desertifilum tharense IPPAS B-1220 TaxID=1781255 RepID=A0A1E5QGS3_9CYAN|nr:hypothetical protein BH720_17465 [Desertifilum tharense IPPAS B-1220]